MNKQIIALIGVLVALSGGLATAVISCFNAQQNMIEQQSKTISELHSDYNERIINLIIKGNNVNQF